VQIQVHVHVAVMIYDSSVVVRESWQIERSFVGG